MDLNDLKQIASLSQRYSIVSDKLNKLDKDKLL